MLELRGIVKRYVVGGEELCPLAGVSWTVQRGELAALYGPSGSGKSTLLNIIAAELRPDAGEVLVGGRVVTDLDPREAAAYRMHDIGYVSQDLTLMPGATALDHAALKLYRHLGARDAERRITPLLHRLGLGRRLYHRAHELSAGERQRVQIALALSNDPALVIADEPTGALDATRSREVLTLLAELCQERDVAMLLATHDPEAARFATTARELRDGHLLPHRPSAATPVAQREGEPAEQR
jgi:putative ABC transport system ATP-binding protein